ncbi:unnamed protein product [Brassicogethes aeneus]|uniref:SCP domain-containing protein n=1 Tax=Brassicogethes aeneus TaxID=1431903 RepID=A0A9P0B5W6_BRAAE|nr:unnamed protein product [Brassicogethes aeneus]
MKFILMLIILFVNNSARAAIDYDLYCNKLSCKDKGKNTVCLRKDEKCEPVKTCAKFPMTGDHREAVRTIHNELRNKFAGGKDNETSKTASNMMVINYDIALEEVMRCYIHSCIFDHDKCRITEKFDSVGQNLYYAENSNPKWDMKDVIKSAANSWYSEIKDVTSDQYDGFHSSSGPAIGHFTQMVWAKTEFIGCAASTSTDKKKLYFGCNYGPAGNVLQTPILKWGPPCSESLDYELYCNELYCDEEKNTVCLRKYDQCEPRQNCENLPMSAETREEVRTQHNEFRNKFAGGKDDEMTNTTSNMMVINYDMELEEVVRCHINTCIWGHDKCRRTEKFERPGQNLYQKTGGDNDLKVVIKSAVKRWYQEIKYMTPNQYDSFYPPKTASTKQQIGHFTQLVWAKTEFVGCAASKSSDGSELYFGCNYGPGGNVLDTSILKWGPPCSVCKNGLKCNEKYESLCGVLLAIPDSAKLDYDLFCKELSCKDEKNTVCLRKDEKCQSTKNCDNVPLTPDHRQLIVDLHNEYRNKFAGGKDSQKTTSNMMVINYDMELEEVHTCHLNTCTMGHDKCRKVKRFNCGQNLYFRRDEHYEVDNIMKTAMRVWYAEKVNMTPEVYEGYHDNGKEVGHFTALVWAKSSLIGCALNLKTDIPDYKYEIYFGCNYGTAGNVFQKPVVNWGPPCSACEENLKCNSKYESLCGVLLAIPGAASQGRPTELDYDLFCKELSCKDVKNTVCLRKDEKCQSTKNCDNVPLSADHRQTIVDLHNEYRNKFAGGKDSQKTTSNMNVINYDMELEEVHTTQRGLYVFVDFGILVDNIGANIYRKTSVLAIVADCKCHLNTCTMGHDKCRKVKRFNCGQNLYFRRDEHYEVDNIMKTAMRVWYAEKVNMTPDIYEGYYDSGRDVGHFTALVWAKSSLIGCALNLKTDIPDYKYEIYFGCNYGTAGNVFQKPVVNWGPPCSACEENLKCNTKYESLCGVLLAIPGAASQRRPTVVVVGAKSQGSCACDLMKCLKVEKCDEGEKKVPYGPCNCCHMCVPEYTDDVDPLNGCTQEVCEKVKCLKNSNCAKDEVRSVYGPCKCCAICIPASLGI